MIWDNIAVAVFSSLVTYAITELRHALAERKKRINDVSERYIDATKAEGFSDTKAARMFAMQRAGVAGLRGHREVGEFFKMVTQRGFSFPMEIGDWHPIISQATLPGILHEASGPEQAISGRSQNAYDTSRDLEYTAPSPRTFSRSTLL